MIIAQVSDTHIDLDCPDTGRRLADFAQTIADINALELQPDVIVHTGDIVHNGRRDEYGAAAAIMAEARAPVFVLAGNKDNRENLHEAFAEYGYLSPDPGFIHYAIEDFPLRLIVLDTMTTRSNKGDFCRERADRLIDMMGAVPSRLIVVFTHHPPYVVTEGPEAHHFETRESAVRLRRALHHSDRVAAVFTGHVHRAVSGDVKGIPASSMPSIATSLRKGDYPAELQNVPVYHLHHFDPDGGLTSETRIVGTESQKPVSQTGAPRQRQALSRP